MAHERPESSTHQDADLGYVLLAVRKDTPTALADADGQYHVMEVDSAGRLWVNVGATTQTEYAAGAVPATPTGGLDMGLVGDAPPYYIDAEIRPLSLTNDGRLRVSVTPARFEVPFFSAAQGQMWDTLEPDYTQTGSPWTDW